MAKKATKTQVEATQAAAVEAVETVGTQAEDIQTEEKVAESTQEEPKKAPTKRRTAKKEASKKEAVKAEAVKADTKGEAKTSTRRTVQQCNLYVQYAGKSYSEEELVKIAKDVWKYDLKRKVTELKSVDLYVKPEENMVYYVINKEVTGSFAI